MKTELFNQVETTTNELIQLIDSLSEEQLNKIPFEGSWTAAQVGDHLLKSYSVAETLSGNIKTTERNPEEKTEIIKKVFLDFNTKMESPGFIIPSDTLIAKTDLLMALKNRIDQLKEIIRTQDLSQTCLDFSIPGLGEFTRSEWLYFMVYHSQRHIHQLKNICTFI